jgi:dihydroorotase-like cyclic amidohydrolase
VTDQARIIRNAELLSADGHSTFGDVRLVNTTIQAVGRLQPEPGDQIIDAGGCLLIPGLQDHHMHLMSYAASILFVAARPM